MPELNLPDSVVRFLAQPNAAVIAVVRPDGYPMTVATWYDWEDGRILVNMSAARARLAWMRSNPRVALTILDTSWYSHFSVYGDVVSIHDDPDLADIDRLSIRYGGRPFQRRNEKRVSAWIEPRGWHEWELTGD